MSLEAKIEALTAAVVALTDRMNGQQASTVVPPIVAAAPQAPVAAPPSLPAASAPVAAPMQPPMPAAPSFVPQAAPAPMAAPFTDAKGMLDYVMATYKALGQAKGAKIQGVLQSMGVANINDVPANQYGALFAAVEALKAA